MLFDVILPLYNKEAYIEQTVTSVLSQTYRDFNLIIVDDGSTDNSLKIVEAIEDERITIFKKENGGVSSARNYGILNSSSEWIALIDADDIWEDNHLLLIADAIQQYHTADVVFSCYYEAMKLKYENNGLFELVHNYSTSLCKHEIHTSAICFNRHLVWQAGLFNTNISVGEDIDMWCRLLVHSKDVIRVNRITSKYTMNVEGNLSDRIHPPAKHFGYYVYSTFYETGFLKRIRKQIRCYMLYSYLQNFRFKYLCIVLCNTPINKLVGDLAFIFRFPFLFAFHQLKKAVRKVIKRDKGF